VSLLELTDGTTSPVPARLLPKQSCGTKKAGGAVFFAQKLARAGAARRFNKATIRIVREEGTDLLFVRLNRLDISLLGVLRRASRVGCWVVLELPTYPYLPEIRKMPFPVNLYWEAMDWLCRPFLKRYVATIVTCAPDETVFGVRCVRIPNGYDFNQLPLRRIRRPATVRSIFLLSASSKPGMGMTGC
jgi:hypothetical protein